MGFYSELIEELVATAVRASSSLLKLRNLALREEVESQLSDRAGEENSFMASPVFEATFGWETGGMKMSDLANDGILSDAIVSAMNKPHKSLRNEYRFPSDRKPYQHQLEAWKILSSKESIRSTLISSGTGSGKTECYMVPIFSRLAELLSHSSSSDLVGVRALFLYPLNALMESQRDRMKAWLEPFDGGIRYCNYKGDLPERVRSGSSDWRCEISDRKTLRDSPPPILLTNSTMLELMLIRQADQPILERSYGRLEYVVIDEAHTYIGSQAAELSMLLRRVLLGFRVHPSKVRFIATSATIGDDSAAGDAALAEFIAGIAGVKQDQVTVIRGRRCLPELLPTNEAASKNLSELQQLDEEELYEALSSEKTMLTARKALSQKAMTLKEIESLFCKSKKPTSSQEVLNYLDLGCNAKKNGEVFLPLRSHFFQKTVSGIWGCINEACSQKPKEVAGVTWPFGAIFLIQRETCACCSSPVYQLSQCRYCNEVFFEVSEVDKRIVPKEHRLDIYDEFRTDLSDESEESVEEEIIDNHCLITSPLYIEGGLPIKINKERSFELNGVSESFLTYHYSVEHCPKCSTRFGPRSPLLPLRASSNFLIKSAVPKLLAAMPSEKRSGPSVYGSRRLITFSDSRQGTAKLGSSLQGQSERSFVESFIYHYLGNRSGDEEAVEKIIALKSEIDKIRQEVVQISGNSNLEGMLKDLLNSKVVELAGLEKRECTWIEMEDAIRSSTDFQQLIFPNLKASTNLDDDERLASLCLYREFLFRPRRLNSLESMGLVGLRYPKLSGIKAPVSVLENGVTDSDWEELCTVAVNSFMRVGRVISIQEDIRRWTGFGGVTRPMSVPGSGEHTRVNWPVNNPRNSLTRLVAVGLGIPFNEIASSQKLQIVMMDLFNSVLPLMDRGQQGLTIDFRDKVVLYQPSSAMSCPLTGNLLNETFRSYTQYLGFSEDSELYRCHKIDLPTPPAFGIGHAEGIKKWLECDEVVRLRKSGLWPDQKDRVVEFSPYFRGIEHSAQISSDRLQKRERDFKEGKINVLSCSTTMEMGVDIGGLKAVVMTNAPPNPSNFLQRAGRAGRRGEGASLSYTLCNDSPHGQQVFSNPLWPFETSLRPPRVSLESQVILLRHLNAYFLSRYFEIEGRHESRWTRCASFFRSENGLPPALSYCKWLKSDFISSDEIRDGLSRMLVGTSFSNSDDTFLIDSSSKLMEDIYDRWTADWNSFDELRKEFEPKDPAYFAISIQVKRLEEEQLFRHLASEGYLPLHGFPVHVVPFVNTTMEEILEAKRMREENRENWVKRQARNYPSRDLSVAIREYAPGNEIVLDQKVYRSSGVTLNWHIPPGDQQNFEPQAMGWLWRCNNCGENGIQHLMPDQCSTCGNADLTKSQFLKPSGFAVDIRHQTHVEEGPTGYIPVLEPLVSLAGNTEQIKLGPHVICRTSDSGRVIHQSRGRDNAGYCICLKCGRAESMGSEEFPQAMIDHRRLRGGKEENGESVCSGGDPEGYGMKRNVLLVHESRTDMFEIICKNPFTGGYLDEAQATTLSVAISMALCQILGIDSREVSSTVSKREVDGLQAEVIYIFDSLAGGGGYSSQGPSLFPELLSRASEIINCSAECDRVCHACLLDHETQYKVSNVDRHCLIENKRNIIEALLESFALLENRGHESERMELLSLQVAIRKSVNTGLFKKLHLMIKEDAITWGPMEWNFRHDLLEMCLRSNIEISMHISDWALKNALSSDQKRELGILLSSLGKITLYRHDSTLTNESGRALIATLEGGESRNWSVLDEESLVPCEEWGNSSAVIVSTQEVTIPQGTIVPLEELLPRPSGVEIVEIKDDGNWGVLSTVSEKIWDVIREAASEFTGEIECDDGLESIEYRDRYLMSPFSLSILDSFLARFVCPISIWTQEVRQERRSPRAAYHNWGNGEHRDACIQKWLRGGMASLRTFNQGKLQHAREMTFRLKSGQDWKLSLDMGFGAWSLMNYQESEFPFSRSFDEQIKALNELSEEPVVMREKKTVFTVSKIF